MQVYFLVGAGGFARTAARAASRLWSAPQRSIHSRSD